MYMGGGKYSTKIFDLVEAVFYQDYDSEKSRKQHIEKEYEACKEILNELRNLRKPISFDDMFAYAKFIKDMELVYMYQNTDKAPVCCDKYTDTECTLFFPFEERKVYIKIEMQYATVNSKRLAIKVYREYGAKLTTTFKVENGKADFGSDEELMLANTINAYVQKQMAMIFETYMELAYHGAIYDCVVGTEEEETK